MRGPWVLLCASLWLGMIWANPHGSKSNVLVPETQADMEQKHQQVNTQKETSNDPINENNEDLQIILSERPVNNTTSKPIEYHVEDYQETMQKLASLLEARETDTDLLKNTPVAFTAELSQETPVGEGSTVIFDRVLVNEGGLYYNSIGVFGCIDNALYAFVWSLQSPNTFRGVDQGKGKLMIGENEVKYGPVTRVLFDGCSSYYNGCLGSSQMVAIARCRQGMGFRIVAEKSSETTQGSVFYPGNSSFTGFKIASSEEESFAFSAETSKDISVFPETVITFNSALYEGDRFNDLYGYFKCPDNGVYMFSWSIQAQSTTKAAVSLCMEGEEIIQGPRTYMNAAYSSAPNSGTSTQSAVLQCIEDHHVHIQSTEVTENLYNIVEAGITSFSGFKISDSTDTFAFTAQLTSDFILRIVGDKILYDNTILNIGNAYNDGVFTCPNNNLFVFMWSLHAKGDDVYVQLMVGSEVAKTGPATTYTSTSQGQGTSGTASMAAVVRCSEGQEVSVQLAQYKYIFIDVGPRVYIIGTFNTFSGFQLPFQT